MDFSIGKVFDGEYPPEAAVWCNTRGDCSIQHVDGKYQIVENPPVSLEILAENARSARDRRIAETDYYMMPDYPSDPNNIEEMKVYRQALRDIPKQEGFPSKFTWPDVPKFLCEDNSDNLGLAKVGL